MQVVLAYYYNGFPDSLGIVIAVCDSDATAAKEIEEHKKIERFYSWETHEKWWTETVEVKTGG